MTLQEMQTDILKKLYEKTLTAVSTSESVYKSVEVLHNTAIAFSMCMREMKKEAE